MQVGAEAPPRLPSERLKRSFDLTAAGAILFVLPPLIALPSLTLLSQGRPRLIRHRRIGRGGAPLPCLKLRTRVRDADAVLQRHLAAVPAAGAEWDSSRRRKADPHVPAHRYREVRPSLTGARKVGGRGDTSCDQRTALDGQSVASRSYGRGILPMTVPTVLMSRGNS